MPIVRDILLGAARRKANLDSMCRELGIDPSELYRSDINVPFEKAYRAWEIAVDQTADPQLGLHLGEQTNPSILGLVGHLMQSCPNLEDAFRTVCNYSSMATDMFTYSILIRDDQVVLSFGPCAPWIKVSPNSAGQAVDQAMAGTLNVFRLLSGKNIVPIQVLVARGKPKNRAEYERVFQVSPKWNSETNSLVFDRRQLSTTILSYDESLMGLFGDLIRKRLSQMKTESTFGDQVRREIMTTFKGQLASIESMAARFNTTVRSFQRKLDEENLSYRELCNSLGKEFAVSLLKNKNTKVSEIATALGYSDTRAFQRAFKAWTGRTPGEFRKA